MKKINRMILWGTLLTTLLVVACIQLRVVLAKSTQGEQAADVVTAICLLAGYLILVVGMLVVGTNCYQNLILRRADATLQTPGNQWHFKTGVAFCILGLASIFLPVL